jgi:uncharacterized protein YbaA (DUF1428 family)
MYVAAMVIPVPTDNMPAYRRWAERSAAIFRRYGCIEIVEAEADMVPRGKATDFWRAVDARADETIVIAWQMWPSKAALDDAEARMHADGALDTDEPIPFDASRLILGCFAPFSVA